MKTKAWVFEPKAQNKSLKRWESTASLELPSEIRLHEVPLEREVLTEMFWGRVVGSRFTVSAKLLVTGAVQSSIGDPPTK